MSTHAAIIYHTAAGYSGIYCHNSGYLQGVGSTLYEHYRDERTVARLIALGDLSCLGERLEPIGHHRFDAQERGTTCAYIRDRDHAELLHDDFTLADFEAKPGETVEDVTEQIDAEFIYVFEDGRWSVNGEDLQSALDNVQLIGSDARYSTADIVRGKQAREVQARAARRLIAPDLDLSGDWVDPRMADNPLLAWCQ